MGTAARARRVDGGSDGTLQYSWRGAAPGDFALKTGPSARQPDSLCCREGMHLEEGNKLSKLYRLGLRPLKNTKALTTLMNR